MAELGQRLVIQVRWLQIHAGSRREARVPLHTGLSLWLLECPGHRVAQWIRGLNLSVKDQRATIVNTVGQVKPLQHMLLYLIIFQKQNL